MSRVGSAHSATKDQARRAVLAARRVRTRPREAEAAALASWAPAVPGSPSSPVAGFVPLPDEPPVGALLDALEAAGRPVLLPVLCDDGDLDWVARDPTAALVPGRRGTRHPSGRLLGRSAVATCGAVLTPALAVDRRGVRLGRGGGSYDRVLARLPAVVVRLAVVFDEELSDEPLPVEAHDAPVDAVLTPRAGVRAVG